MSFFNQYPYMNINDLNLDYLLNAIKEMRNEVTNFVSINAIKYADPIQWDITRQYEKNTIVIDPVTGTAYISVAPVPAGVALTRPEYWTVVFDLQSFVTKANQNLANNYEEQTTTTATMNTAAGDWVIWGDVLYKALVNITAGDAYVVGSNIQRITIEDVIKAMLQDIADEVQARQNSDTALRDDIDAEALARSNADSALRDDIDAEALARGNADSALRDDIDAEALARAAADGDLTALHTIVKTSLVNAINDVLDYNYRALSSFAGANDTEIFQNAINGCDYLMLDRDITISSVEINNPIKINLNGHTITSNTNATNTIDIICSDVEIFNGRIYTTEADPNNARAYGSCILTKNYPDLISPPKMKNINLHDLYLSSNGAVLVSLCGECYNCDVYNIVFDGDRTNKGNMSVGLNIEWFGTPHVNTWHPHDIYIHNIVGHHLTDGLRTAAAFNITMENCFFYYIYKSALSLGEGIEIAVGDWGNEAAQPEYKDSVNKNIVVRNLAVYNGPAGIHAMGHQYGNVECFVDGLVFSTGSYDLGRAVFLQSCENWEVANVEATYCNNGMMFNGCNNIDLHDCKVHNMQSYGVYVTGCSNMKIHDNRFYDVNRAGLSGASAATADLVIYSSTKAIIKGNITGGGTNDNTRVDIYWYDSTNCIVTDNLYDVGLSVAPESFIVDNNLEY